MDYTTEISKLQNIINDISGRDIPPDMKDKLLSHYNGLINDYRSKQLSERQTMYENPNSEYYQKAQENFRKTLADSGPTTNSLLGLAISRGGNYEGSRNIAQKQMKQITGNQNEAAEKFSTGLFVQGQSTANNILGMALQNDQFYQELGLRRQQLSAQRQEAATERASSFTNNILGVGASIAGQYFGGGFGSSLLDGLLSKSSETKSPYAATPSQPVYDPYKS